LWKASDKKEVGKEIEPLDLPSDDSLSYKNVLQEKGKRGEL